jgi:hypothetical protein
MVDVGPVITPPGQYTHCVDRKDYRDIPGVLDNGIPAILEFLLCDYLLGGKLVCLSGGGDQCAIGTVVGLEAVGAGKSGIEALDTDFSFNVLLAPFEVQDFSVYGPPPPANIADPHAIRDDSVKNGPLGWLMVDSPNPDPLPAPVDQTGAPGPPFKTPSPRGTATWPVDGYGVLWKLIGSRLVDANREGDNLHKLWDKPPDNEWPPPPPPSPPDLWIPLPVSHCECEGSRIFFVCQAMKPFLDLLQGKMPGGGPSPGEVCHAVAKWLPWPIDKIVNAVCSLVEDLIALPIAIALAPAMAAAFATAWEAAQAFDDLFVTGPVAKQIHIGDIVIVRGRWDWDAGHSGHTELHPVKSIQKLMSPTGSLPPEIRPPHDLSTAAPVDYNPRHVGGIPPAVAADITLTHQQWCRFVAEAPPPPDPRQPGGLSAPQLASMTPEQLSVWAAQNQPENSWTVHPLLDGCAPHEPATPIG